MEDRREKIHVDIGAKRVFYNFISQTVEGLKTDLQCISDLFSFSCFISDSPEFLHVTLNSFRKRCSDVSPADLLLLR